MKSLGRITKDANVIRKIGNYFIKVINNRVVIAHSVKANIDVYIDDEGVEYSSPVPVSIQEWFEANHCSLMELQTTLLRVKSWKA